MNFIEAMIDLVDSVILTYVLDAFDSLSPTVAALWRVMFIIFIALFGYKAMFSGQFSFNELIVNSLKIVVVLILATQAAPFTVFLFQSFTELPNEVAGRVLTGAQSTVNGTTTANSTMSANDALGSFFDRGMVAGKNLTDGAGWRDFGLYLYAFFIWIVTILLTGYALMLIVLSKLALAILLAVGPLFILLLMFTSSRGFFEGWFRALVNYATIPIFVYSLLALILRLVEGPLVFLEAASTTGQQVVGALGPFALIGIISFVLLLQVTTMAAGVSGGFALSTMNFASNVTNRLRGAAGGGRVGREMRELGYLKATKGLQGALTKARFGGTRPSQPRQDSEPPKPDAPPKSTPSETASPNGAAQPATGPSPSPSPSAASARR